MGPRLKVGIAGYGVVGKRRHIFIDKNPLFQTVAVSDTKLETGYLDNGQKAFSSTEEMLDEDLDVLFVSLPNFLAPSITVKGLQSGCHVFCEKPPGKNVMDMQEVMDIALTRPTQKLKYGFNHRYHDSIRDALQIISSKRLGNIISMRGVYGKSSIVNFESDWRTKRNLSGGGILLDQGIHMVDMMRMFAGEFDLVHSIITNDYWGHDVEDNAYVLMRTNSGVVASLHSSATQWRHTFRLEIIFESGLVELSGILSGSKSYGKETISITERSDDLSLSNPQVREYFDDNSWRDEVNDFANAIQHDLPISTGSIEDALSTMRLVERIYNADDAWRTQYLLNHSSQ